MAVVMSFLFSSSFPFALFRPGLARAASDRNGSAGGHHRSHSGGGGFPSSSSVPGLASLDKRKSNSLVSPATFVSVCVLVTAIHRYKQIFL